MDRIREIMTEILTRQRSGSWLPALFESIPRRFLTQIEVITVPADRRLITKGDINPYIYILYEGRVRISNEFENGRVFFFATTEVPAFSGLLEMLSGNEMNSSTVETMQDSRFIRIRKSVFSRWMEEDIRAFRLTVSIFARQLYPSLLTMGSYAVYPKYIVLLQYLVRNYELSTAGHRETVVEETREELSEKLGFSLRTVYRLTSRLSEEGLGQIRKKKIVLTPDHIGKMKSTIARTPYEHQT